MKLAVVLFNLGGPDSLESVEPFLRNLFSDRAVMPLPTLVRKPLARWVAKRRAPIARDIYEKIGGRSPILEETEAQARALEAALAGSGYEAKAFVAMRAWKPFAAEAAAAIRAWQPDKIVLLPLYPQFSTTTSGSSLDDWERAADRAQISMPQTRVCCYPRLDGFIAAETALLGEVLARRQAGVDYRLLLSAHGLPKRTISNGDPYQWQVEKTAQAIVDGLGISQLDWRLCYQSRVGPLEWIGPATDAEIRRAGMEGKGLIVAPIAFVSEHSETLVELDIEYARLASESGVPHYLRVPTVGTHPRFVDALAGLVMRAAEGEAVVTCAEGRICPASLTRCGYRRGDV
ncbi:MAG TPA: ferrochelatase [Rhizomicrobium sp.]